MTTGQKTIQWIWLAALLLTPFVLWLLPSDIFDDSKVILCPSRLLFNVECLGCGMTRAVMHLHHFEFADAMNFNRMVVLGYPALVVLWAFWVLSATKKLGILDGYLSPGMVARIDKIIKEKERKQSP